MVEVRVLTVMLDSRTGVFDDEYLRAYLVDREVQRAEPYFFVHEGKPHCAVFLQTRTLQGARVANPPDVGESEKNKELEYKKQQFEKVLNELDETQRSRFDRLLNWRRSTSRCEGAPAYILLDNTQLFELALTAPKTLAALEKVKGIGKKKIARYGNQILEVMHGTKSPGRTEPIDPVRKVDGNDETGADQDHGISQEPAPHADREDRPVGARDTRGSDDGGVPEESPKES